MPRPRGRRGPGWPGEPPRRRARHRPVRRRQRRRRRHRPRRARRRLRPARDTDGDGKPDALESRTADADHDCLADEVDADDAAPALGDPRLAALVAATCPTPAGVCAAAGATLAVVCDAGQDSARCDFGAVPDHEADETSCDAKDNDCDGQTDEPAACAPTVLPIDVDLVGHWPLDGDGKDVGPFHDDGQVTGATPVADRFGHAGKALRFDASGDRVTVAATHHPLGEVSVTYSAWVRPEPDHGAATGVLAFGDVLVPNQRSSLVVWGARSCLEYTGEQNDFDARSACAPDGRWSMLAAVKVGRHVKLYLNGRLQAEGDLQPGQALDSTHLEIGLSRRTDDGDVYEQFHGAIDDVRAWSRALTADELDGLYREGDWADVGSGANPGASCLHVRDGGRPSGDGLYWLDPLGTGTASQVYCDMTLDGGGWALAWVYGFTAPASFMDIGNAVTPVPSWRASNVDVPVSTTAPSGPTSRGAIDWAAWSALGNEVAFSNSELDTIACKVGAGSLVDGTTGDVACRVLEEKNPTCDGVLPQYLAWVDTGPLLGGPSLYLYFDAATDKNWPTHDPCATNTAPSTADADAGGAVWLRPSDDEVRWPRACAEVPELDRGSAIRIDPDGPGGSPPIAAECDFATERGGWTRLTADVARGIQSAGPRPRQYLIAKGGAWYRSPVTTAVWDWASYDEAPGVWVHDGPAGDGAFDCGGGAPAHGASAAARPGRARRACSPAAAPALRGRGPRRDQRVPGAARRAFQVGGAGCADDASVWVRPSRCLPDAGEPARRRRPRRVGRARPRRRRPRLLERQRPRRHHAAGRRRPARRHRAVVRRHQPRGRQRHLGAHPEPAGSDLRGRPRLSPRPPGPRPPSRAPSASSSRPATSPAFYWRTSISARWASTSASASWPTRPPTTPRSTSSWPSSRPPPWPARRHHAAGRRREPVHHLGQRARGRRRLRGRAHLLALRPRRQPDATALPDPDEAATVAASARIMVVEAARDPGVAEPWRANVSQDEEDAGPEPAPIACSR
ncbi:MAG: fibrinogen-like YCDxxxxGGGW domain-containing protein [Myxococcota bacterium]